MLEHHIQKTIVYSLAHAPSLRFAELQPEGIENKLFSYHLKSTIRDGYVFKSDDGSYQLTPEGKAVWAKQVKNRTWYSEAPYSVIFMVIRREDDGAWLLGKRKTHPLINMSGFIHAAPTVNESIVETAQRVLLEKTGITGAFTYRGSGYLRIFNGDDLESFTQFNMVACEDAEGPLQDEDSIAEYFWTETIDVDSDAMIPNMPTLVEAYQSRSPFFIERTIRYN